MKTPPFLQDVFPELTDAQWSQFLTYQDPADSPLYSSRAAPLDRIGTKDQIKWFLLARAVRSGINRSSFIVPQNPLELVIPLQFAISDRDVLRLLSEEEMAKYLKQLFDTLSSDKLLGDKLYFAAIEAVLTVVLFFKNTFSFEELVDRFNVKHTPARMWQGTALEEEHHLNFAIALVSDVQFMFFCQALLVHHKAQEKEKES